MIEIKTCIIFIALLMCIIENVAGDQWPPQKWMDVISPVTEKCIGDVGININVVQNARKGDLPDDENFKKYLLCIFNSMDLIDKEHHEFEFWKVLTMIPQEMKRPVFELGKGCLHISGEDYGKACLEFMTCLKKGNSEKFSFMF